MFIKSTVPNLIFYFRYRIQADSYPALYLIMSELERRLSLKLDNKSNTTNTNPTTNSSVSVIKCADLVPVDDYFNLINLHFQSRQKLVKLNNELNNAAHQYR